MKKKIFLILLILSCGFAFAEKSINLRFSLDSASSFSPQPFLGANISVDYNWQNGFALGSVIKIFAIN